ncbi:DUF6799 domain-containing protein [Hymenobacter rubidus]|uniref:DUF6799 domain-containing protein n=1 Tax=Hymenobacter rubidus TaxID=1441626 RepID=UPI00191DF10F|nr:DUF6799 domain-containing protein [Hymenobacter rubidus]
MQRFLLLSFAAACLATAPRLAAAQDGGFPVQTTKRTEFVMKNGEVMRREGSQVTALTQNVKLDNGVKINYKSGIVEMPTDRLHPVEGKKITLHEGDYVRPDGGIVFATPSSAAAARGEEPKPMPAGADKFDTYVQRGPGFSDPVTQVRLLNQKVDLLTQKVFLLSQGRTEMPDTKAIDSELAKINSQLTVPK